MSSNTYPSIHWEKFFAKFKDIDNIKIEDWGKNELIAYFCRKYKEHYNLDYTFKFNSSAPSKSYEIYNFSKLSSMLSSSGEILKDYIDWFFQEKIIAKKRRITSLAFLTDANVVNEYKFKKLAVGDKSVDRTTIISPQYLAIVKRYDDSLSKYGELAFIKKSIEAGNDDPKYKELLIELFKNGFDLGILDRVK